MALGQSACHLLLFDSSSCAPPALPIDTFLIREILKWPPAESMESRFLVLFIGFRLEIIVGAARILFYWPRLEPVSWIHRRDDRVSFSRSEYGVVP